MADTKYLISFLETNNDNERTQEALQSFVTAIEESNLEARFEKPDNYSVNGHKGDPLTIGALILVISPAILPTLIQFMQNWVTDKRRISVEAPNGAKVEFTPSKQYSEIEIIELVKSLNAIPVKKTKKK